MLLCFAADTPTVRPPVNHSEQQQPAHGSGCGRRAIWPTARSAPLCAPAAERATRPSACKEREINVFLSLTVCSRHLARGTGGSEDWEWALPGRYWPPGPEFPGTPCPHLPGVRDPETAWTCLGAKGRRPISSREEDPQTSLPSLPPLKKRVKKKKNPTHGERRLGLAGLCSRALHGSVTRLWLPVRALSQAPRSLERPWRGFSRVRSRHSRPSREGATGPREAPSFLLSGGRRGGHALFSHRSLDRYQERLGEPPEGNFFLALGRKQDEKSLGGGCYWAARRTRAVKDLHPAARSPWRIVPRSRKGAAGSAPARRRGRRRLRVDRPQLRPCLSVLFATVDAALGASPSAPGPPPGCKAWTPAPASA